MNLSEEQINEFNKLYDNACKKMKGIVILDHYRPKSIGFFEKLRANKAIRLFEKALQIVPEHFASLFFTGKIYQRFGQYEKALWYFEKAMEFEKQNHSLPQEASLVAMHLGQIDKAIQYSEDALKRAPGHIALMGNHSMNLLIAGKDSEAEESIKKALETDPDDAINKNIQKRINDVISGKTKRPLFDETL